MDGSDFLMKERGERERKGARAGSRVKGAGN